MAAVGASAVHRFHPLRRRYRAGVPSDVDLVVFDCDGVLVDSERLQERIVAESLRWLGVGDDAEALTDQLFVEHRGGSLPALFAMMADVLDAELPADFEDRFRAHQLGVLRTVELVPGAEAALDVVDAAGVARCVASGGPMEKMRVSLGATGLWDRLHPRVYSCYDIGASKPAPDIYLHVTADMGTTPDRSIAVEDSVHGVTAAARAGLRVIGLARDVASELLLAAGAAVTVASMTDAAALLATELEPRLD